MKKQVIVFASGSGSNAENLIHYFREHAELQIKITAIFCNNPNAGVIERAERLKVPVRVFTRTEFQTGIPFDVQLEQYKPDLIVLAGFLWLFPLRLIHKYPNKIINIHPALLPRHGGKGMYGHHVHQAVLDSRDKEHGVSVHYVNENFDEGEIIVQEKFNVSAEDTLQSLEKRIHEIEFSIYPKTIAKILK
jgi:phosphoribosylglycinamide formyltransferase 1